MKKYFIIIIALFGFTACSLPTLNKPSNGAINFKSITEELTIDLCSHIKKYSLLYMTDFVNERDLKNKSQLGFLLSNELKVNILDARCTQRVSFKSLQLSKSLMSNNTGNRILTRNFKQLKVKNLQDNKQILVGSYIITKKQLLLFVKLINLKNNNIIASTSSSTNITDEIKELEGINTKKEVPYIYKPLHL